MRRRDSGEETDWYSDSASGLAKSLERHSAQTDWYSDSAKGIVDSLQGRDSHEETDWYSDSASGVAKSFKERAEETNWYSDSAKGVVDSLPKRNVEDSDWYSDSASGVVNSLDKREAKKTEDDNWYSDSASGMAKSLESRDSSAETDWYSDSAAGVANSIQKRALSVEAKEDFESDLRRWIYSRMRDVPLRDSSERGKAFFEFTPKPRTDFVDRWHVPIELEKRFQGSGSDAEKVSVLNYYLMVTGREPKSATELGFKPTASEPTVVEGNEVGYGYAFGGQHQYHCADFVADAIDIGKDNLNDFYLKHTIHCLGLIKYLAPELKMKQPLSFLRAPAAERLRIGYAQTRS
ncbi:MAG: hypothetical protein Q9165_008001 [Trypethelium subeluteriae]